MPEEKPSVLWFNGKIVPWEQGCVHVWSEVAIRGTNVFEGIRAYWNPRSETYRVVCVPAHLRRLHESAKILRFPVRDQTEELGRAIEDLVRSLGTRGGLYVRPTLYVEEGRFAVRPEEVVMGSYVTGFPIERSPLVERGARCCVSSWRRSDDLTFLPRVKSGAAYQALRWPRIEAAERGLDDALLLNARGTLAEASGAAVFVKRRGRVSTPPVYSSILESITRDVVIRILETELGASVDEREIDRSELYVADEVFMCGTLSEITPIVEVDGVPVGSGTPGDLTRECQRIYLGICEGRLDDKLGIIDEIHP